MTRLIVLAAGVFVVGGVLFALSVRNMTPGTRRARWRKFFVYLVLVAAVIALGHAGAAALTAGVVAITARGAFELRAVRRGAGGAAAPIWVWAPYGAVAAFAVTGAALSSAERILFVFAVIAAFDGASQLSGQLFGRRRLAPVVSPNKTVEGLIGGLIAAVLTAGLLAPMVPAAPAVAAAAAIPMGAVALAGDLSASWVKRRAGVKDYPTLFPGHGGVLDRFDGFLPNCAALTALAWT